MNKKTIKKVLLIVLDGVGIGKDYKYNAVTRAKTPYLKSLIKNYPNTALKTSGNSVGLPKNTMGGSEVGHYTMGAGKIVYQSLEEINRQLKSKEIFQNKLWKNLVEKVKKDNTSLHFIGMISDAGVHSHINHLIEFLKEAKREKIKNIFIHAITDGRDTKEKSAKKFIKIIQKNKIGKIATIVGRYYAMDRDKNYERTQKAYDLITLGEGIEEKDPIKAIENQYKENNTDYYIKSIILNKDGVIKKNDHLVFFNFRTDRAYQITKALTEKSFSPFKRKVTPFPKLITLGSYTDKKRVLISSPNTKTNLSQILSSNKIKQLKMAETEKFAHVTFFFNTQNKKPYKNEDHILIPSPKVRSYSEKPEMSAIKLTKELIKNIEKSKYSFILVNYANGDLVGHSGDFNATKKAIETLDQCLKKAIPKAIKNDYEIIITADHGNAEYMKFENGTPCVSHTKNPVFCIVISDKKLKLKKNKELGLYNIAPTILDLLNIKKPKEMSGESLIIKE